LREDRGEFRALNALSARLFIGRTEVLTQIEAASWVDCLAETSDVAIAAMSSILW
jgi:hypothetical protein